jgi:hypothetical protein
MKTTEEITLRDEVLIRDIKILLGLVGEISPDYKAEIESMVCDDKRMDMKYSFGEVIRGQVHVPMSIDGFWALIEKDVLKFLAKNALNILKEISEGLYRIY